MAQWKITQVKSRIGTHPTHRSTLQTLGLRKMWQSVVREDTPDVRGLVHKVRYLVTVEEV